MTTYKKDTRQVAIIIAAVLMLSLTGWLWHKDSKELQQKADITTLRHDSLLAEKLLLDKEINDLTISMLSWKNRNASLDSAIQKTNTLLSEKIKTINKLTAENLTVKRLRKELKDLKDIHKSLEERMNGLLAENKQLREEVSRLKEELASKTVEKPEILFILDNFKVALEKKNSKLTVKAKKIRQIDISFDVRSNYKESITENLYVVVKDGEGKVIGANSSPASIKGEKVSYSEMQKAEISESQKKISVSVKATSKIKAKGMVKILVYSEDKGLIATYLSPVM